MRKYYVVGKVPPGDPTVKNIRWAVAPGQTLEAAKKDAELFAGDEKCMIVVAVKNPPGAAYEYSIKSAKYAGMSEWIDR